MLPKKMGIGNLTRIMTIESGVEHLGVYPNAPLSNPGSAPGYEDSQDLLNATSSALRGNLKWFNCSKVTSSFTFFFNHLFVIRFYVQFRGFHRTTRATPRSAPA